MARIQTALPHTDHDLREIDSPHRRLNLAFRLYKALVSPVLHAVSPSRCLYLPTCSEYAYTAISRFGVLRGGWLALCRFARCHPWGKGGLDPVPQRGSSQGTASARVRKGADHLP